MSGKIFSFCLSAFFYWFVESFIGNVLLIPEQVIQFAVFVPPILGLMWGLPAAVGVYVGSLFVLPEFNIFLTADHVLSDYAFYIVKNLWVFLAGFLPYTIWHKWKVTSEELFALNVQTLWKFLAVLFITFFVTTIFRAMTVTTEELNAVKVLIVPGETEFLTAYILTCFVNDLFIAIFFDMAWFFFLISKGYDFYTPKKILRQDIHDDLPPKEKHRAWIVATGFYILFPIGMAYINRYQIYGMDNLETWIKFIAECLTAIDLYLILMLYLLLCYRRSIMLEVVFLVSQTVFLTASVLGWGSSVAVGNLAYEHTNETLREMSVICRERLYRTFFSIRQGVNGMKLQAIDAIESYDRIANDSEYREEYLKEMKNKLSFIAFGIDGSISYYLRIKPEIAGTKGGFSMQREEARWEGALSPYIEREPIDLAPYDPDDDQKVGWYYIPMKSHSATWIEPYVDAVTNFYVISYVAPLFKDGEFLGVIGMDIDFNFIIQELRRMSIYDYGYVYIMDRNNTVLYHRYQPQGTQFKPNPDFQEIDVYLMNGMWLGIATPLTKVYEDRNRILRHLISAIIVVAMIISVVSIALASKAIRPLSGMTEAAKRIASGDLNVKISYESGNELGI